MIEGPNNINRVFQLPLIGKKGLFYFTLFCSSFLYVVANVFKTYVVMIRFYSKLFIYANIFGFIIFIVNCLMLLSF